LSPVKGQPNYRAKTNTQKESGANEIDNELIVEKLPSPVVSNHPSYSRIPLKSTDSLALSWDERWPKDMSVL
jgi:hypothetical protein